MKPPYSPVFIDKMKQSEEDIKAGRTTKIEPADIWNLGMDKTDCILTNPVMIKRLEESRQQFLDGKGIKIDPDLL
jgi:hypothetical protein